MHLVCSAAGAQSHTRAGTFCGRLRRGRYGPEPHLLLQAPPRDRWSPHYLSVRVLERITKVPVQTVMPGSRRPLHPWKSQPRWPYSASLLTRVATASSEASCTSRSSAVTRSAVRPSSAAPACRQNCTGSLLPASPPMRVRNMLSRRGNATALRSLSPVTVPLWVNPRVDRGRPEMRQKGPRAEGRSLMKSRQWRLSLLADWAGSTGSGSRRRRTTAGTARRRPGPRRDLGAAGPGAGRWPTRGTRPPRPAPRRPRRGSAS